jgi:hypothetical protein
MTWIYSHSDPMLGFQAMSRARGILIFFSKSPQGSSATVRYELATVRPCCLGNIPNFHLRSVTLAMAHRLQVETWPMSLLVSYLVPNGVDSRGTNQLVGSAERRCSTNNLGVLSLAKFLRQLRQPAIYIILSSFLAKFVSTHLFCKPRNWRQLRDSTH